MLDTAALVATVISAPITAAGVVAAAYKLWQAYNQARTDFEDRLNREYREIARRIPVKALLGEELDSQEYEMILEDVYNYIDLSNEQAFLRRNGRVSESTWKNWSAGIEANLARPVFRRAWEEIKEKSDGDFAELRKLEQSGFEADPHAWR